MSRTAFRAQLECLGLSGPERAIRDRMLRLLEEPRCFERDCFPAHFTGSALVASRERVLLNHHRKLNRWMQFGGHCDGEENPLAVALREAEEESGISQFEIPFRTPLDLDIHGIPALGANPQHEHYDVRYLLLVPEETPWRVSEESHELRWFTHEEALRLPLDSSVIRLLEKWKRWVAEISCPEGV